MKTILFSLTVLISVFVTTAQENAGINIKVTIDNVANDEGKVIAALHSAETFMKGPGVDNLNTSIENGKVTFTFENVVPGTYAILAMHDANDNQQMDYQENGMPKESYGMSGNEMSMGPPMFEDAKFEVIDKDLEFNIRF